MVYTNKTFTITVEGPFACFTRPEMKVERVSYDVITPSASRGIFEAIFWKPAIRWNIKQIEVLKPILWTSVRRNEVGVVAGKGRSEVFIEDNRQQRAGLFLRDVAYRLTAELEFIPPNMRTTVNNPVPEYLIVNEEKSLYRENGNRENHSADENPRKYNAIFERRARKGQCFYQPFLGCREFSCSFRLVDSDSYRDEPSPIDETRDLGFMLYDLDFSDLTNPIPAFFRAKLEKGVINVPQWESGEVLR